MTLSRQLDITVQEMLPLPLGSCKACERTGIPVLLLREAPIPKTPALNKHGALTHPGLQQTLRVLRSGYVYVLLDGNVWQAYQVTDAGHLRLFDPYEMGRDAPEPLSERCVQHAHDLPASFIGIDVDKYKTAWIAYAQDPWPTAVLDAYKSGATPAAQALKTAHPLRFVIVDLTTLRQDPTAGGAALALEHAHPLHKHVAEYSLDVRDFGSVHGWHSRALQATGMRNYLKMMERQHRLPQGVPGLILPDPVGMAQELNNFRLAAYTQKRMWAEEPQRRYAYLTSQCLLGIEQLYAAQADAEIPASPTYLQDLIPTASGMGPSFWDPAQERRERVAHKVARRMGRLKERYWETDPPSERGRQGRASFQASYDKECKRLEDDIDAYGKDWAGVVRSAAWRRIVDLDYSDIDERSRRLRLLMVSACLDGGITDAVEAPVISRTGAPAVAPKPGPTSQAWQELLSDPHSAVYVALNGQRSDLQSSFLPLFSAGGAANDAAKKYFDAVKGVVSSKEVGAWREGLAADAADQLLAAMHGASSRLHNLLNEGTRAAIDAVHVGGAWLYHGAQMTQVVIQLTVSELLGIYADELQRVGESLNQDTGRRVRAFIFSGLISIPDPALHKILVNVTIWMEGSAEQIAGRIKELKTGAANVTRDVMQDVQEAIGGVTHSARGISGSAMRKLSLGIKHLETPAAQLLIGLELSAEHAREFAKNGFASLKRLSVGSGYGGLSLVSLYFLHDSVRSSLDSARQAVGAEHAEAMAALYGAGIGMLGAGVEAGGLALSVAGEAVQPFMRRMASAEAGMIAKAIGLGKGLVKAGGAIAALGGVADGVGSLGAAMRVAKRGDTSAGLANAAAATLSILGGGFAWAGAIGSGALLGPLGIGIALGLSAFVFAAGAKKLESDALELWARHSYFGNSRVELRWADADHMDLSVAALNAAVMGMEAALGFDSDKRAIDFDQFVTADVLLVKETGGLESGTVLSYRILLPGFDPIKSRYEFTLSIEKFGVEKGRRTPATASSVLATVYHNSQGRAPELDAVPGLVPEHIRMPGEDKPVLRCSYWLGSMHAIKAATIDICYWPDKDDLAGYAQLRRTEET